MDTTIMDTTTNDNPAIISFSSLIERDVSQETSPSYRPSPSSSFSTDDAPDDAAADAGSSGAEKIWVEAVNWVSCQQKTPF